MLDLLLICQICSAEFSSFRIRLIKEMIILTVNGIINETESLKIRKIHVPKYKQQNNLTHGLLQIIAQVNVNERHQLKGHLRGPPAVSVACAAHGHYM